MRELVLLSQVIPAFAALAKEFVEWETDDQRLAQDALDCYSDIINVCHALSVSRGEWAPGLDEQIVAGVLKVLETRLPKSWVPNMKFWSLTATTSPAEQEDQAKFPRLQDLSETLLSQDLGGFDKCHEADHQSSEESQQYLALVTRVGKVSLFHKKEIQSEKERRKFISRVRVAAKHLLGVYYPNPSAVEGDEFNLSRHPSGGTKELANRLYGLLERHWNCRCPQQHFGARLTAGREARLSLIRYRQLAPKVIATGQGAQRCHPAKFEILLPVTKDAVEWKVTNIEVKEQRAQYGVREDLYSVSNDICRLLYDSGGLQVDFVAENDSLWHFRPYLPEDTTNHQTVMESLSQLLGDGLAISDMNKYGPEEKLRLCYLLANSMLFFYPGSWFQAMWSSTKVYFVRRTNTPSQTPSSALPSVLRSPYLSVELKRVAQQNSPPHRQQYHQHPAILALGIILLEIATGTRFIRSQEAEEWKAVNSDGHKAKQMLQTWEKESEKDRSKRIPPALNQAIHSCLELKPPSNFPSLRLTQEGPIRQYILSCIVQPLAKELRDGYKIPLDKLDQVLTHEKLPEKPFVNDTPVLSAFGPGKDTMDCEQLKQPLQRGNESGERERTSPPHGETFLKSSKAASSETWFNKVNPLLTTMSTPVLSNDAKQGGVKIAVIDTGVSENHQYFKKFVYKDFISDPDQTAIDDPRHGTNSIDLILRLVDTAQIYVAKVFQKSEGGLKTPSYMAEAIKWAVQEKVDIINISAGFKEYHEEVHEAIKQAALADPEILIFSAAANWGNVDSVAFPARFTDSVFCIFSCSSALRVIQETNPNPVGNGPHFALVGQDVAPNPGGLKTESGTSIACALAAGLAGRILDFVRQDDATRIISEEHRKRVGTKEGMARIFKEMSTQDPPSHWCLAPWQLLPGKASSTDRNPQDTRDEIFRTIDRCFWKK